MSTSEKLTLGGFILTEMTSRQMSAHEFAAFVGVTHTTINKFLNHGIKNMYAGKPVGEPSIEFLSKLANATGIDICTLVALVIPGSNIGRLRAQLLAERIGRLPPEDQAIIDNFLMGASLKAADQAK